MAEDFPVLWQCSREEREQMQRLGCPRAVPWSLLAPHERRAQRNHGQSLQRLAERGGLSPCEMLAVLEDRSWRSIPLVDAVEQLKAHVR